MVPFSGCWSAVQCVEPASEAIASLYQQQTDPLIKAREINSVLVAEHLCSVISFVVFAWGEKSCDHEMIECTLSVKKYNSRLISLNQ